ncbi:MAG: hypothetical protein A2Y03_07765 [Omnitrophica WOR_2 bacterium GWF2_38_59]|nr:MAG: hypothetical protein A2Y06_01770 [Omnitrophica WOR_2 bacterium GWA2_37_7]OGX26801.1 MAG: hypothetical protein A2Y03_07765 [Omnitrophica WOR_2 bacterium GWF2_38_59]OGX49465.1 MAG: hypothetical protein A2243_09640 [Omnitrophica WOR_2 bacterium RIFOXYA2_FULL_38_17]OGX54768.1 MAG: hypothetical protein A2267_06565 [Omnitrophica WOR_2 bacterium RIFOXYA12_FULL_38_10]OGX57795.1 MAG: hypothetical protein A2447_06860 [Omnitrophica WOR_2 bacterium RIFOXYC2_FULL_38_12]OGX58569.1 MAG: hypothetical 
MRPAKHVIISSGVALIIYGWLHSWLCAFSCLITGVLIDIDHAFDYFFTHKRIPLNFKELDNFCQYDIYGKISLIFHSYELVIALWIVYSFFNIEALLGIAVGATVHLLCDLIANPFKFRSYLLLYRHYHKYERKKFYVDGFFEDKK